nr:NADH dehydrogenase subunit 2 [Membranacea stenoprocessa]
MNFNSSWFFFFFFLTLGVFISLSSNNWIVIWCGLEVGLISFIPLMLNKNYISSECVIKYFIIQSISSSLFMLSILFMLMNFNFNYEFILNVSLMMKMGVAPFHNWVLNVIDGLNYDSVFLLLTFIKIPPLFILSYLSLYMTFFILFTLFFGSVLGLNQNSSRKIIGYSSIFNMGFILSCINFNYIWFFYITFYSLLLYMLIYFLWSMNFIYLNQMILNDYSPYFKFILFMILMSMGGVPPLLGFIIKLTVLEILLLFNFNFFCFIMIMFSLLVMFFYFRLTFLSVMIYSFMLKNNIYLISFNFMIFLMINLIFFPIFLYFKIFI